MRRVTLHRISAVKDRPTLVCSCDLTVNGVNLRGAVLRASSTGDMHIIGAEAADRKKGPCAFISEPTLAAEAAAAVLAAAVAMGLDPEPAIAAAKARADDRAAAKAAAEAAGGRDAGNAQSGVPT